MEATAKREARDSFMVDRFCGVVGFLITFFLYSVAKIRDGL